MKIGLIKKNSDQFFQHPFNAEIIRKKNFYTFHYIDLNNLTYFLCIYYSCLDHFSSQSFLCKEQCCSEKCPDLIKDPEGQPPSLDD